MQYQWILFDLDNTIYDFDRSSKEALQHTFERFSIPHTKENIQLYKQINHQCWTDFENGEMDFATLRDIRFRLFAERIGVGVDATKMGDHYLRLLSEADHMIEGALPLLKKLQNQAKMAVVTNGLKEVKRPQLSRPAISQYFDAIVISEEIGVAKPHRGFFEHTFDLINQPDKSEVIIIGDNLNSDIKGGNDFGISTCWFNPTGKPNQTRIKPDTEIQSLHEFVTVLGMRN